MFGENYYLNNLPTITHESENPNVTLIAAIVTIFGKIF
jgi:hypothetical protein